MSAYQNMSKRNVFIKKSNIKHNNIYDYSTVEYKNCRQKVDIICPLHGIFSQKPSIHLMGSGCPECGRNKISSNVTHFIDAANKKHDNKYDYSKVQYINNKSKVIIICPLHGPYAQTPDVHLRGIGCRECYDEQTKQKTTEDFDNFKHDAMCLYGNQYYYTHAKYINKTTPIDIICRDHGIFKQTPQGHLQHQGCNTCKKAGNVNRKPIADFIDQCRVVHASKYDYSLITYVNTNTKIEINCAKHGVFYQLPKMHLRGHGCPKCSIRVSKPEQKLTSLLNDANITVINNIKNIIPPLELDLYLPDFNLAIEYNGIFWHSELMGKTNSYHLHKTTECNKKDVRLIHIFESEWILKPDIVQSRLKTLIGLNNKIYARNCQIKNIANKESSEFLDANHIQGNCNAKIRLGLFYQNELVGVMTFGKSRFARKAEWELLRFCSKLNTTIVGGASKLFKNFVNTHRPSNIISYSDRRWNTGKLYDTLGFVFSHHSKPNYFYFNKNSLILETRHKYQKHKLCHLLNTFDASLTEWENMKNNKYNRIWDCGNSVWVWTQ